MAHNLGLWSAGALPGSGRARPGHVTKVLDRSVLRPLPPDCWISETEDAAVELRADPANLLKATTRQGATMEAAVGDRIVVAAANLSGHMRDGEIIKVGSHGAPPYLVRWSDDGRETLFFPGPDAHVSHHELHEPESPAADFWFGRRTRSNAPPTCKELARGSVPF